MDLHASWSGLDFSYLWWWTDKTVKPLSLPSLTLGLWHHEFRLRCVISTSSLWSTTPGSSLGVPMRLNPDRSRRFHNPVVKQPCVKDQVIYSVKFLSWPWGREPWGTRHISFVSCLLWINKARTKQKHIKVSGWWSELSLFLPTGLYVV